MLSRWLQRQWFIQRRPTPALWLLLPLHGLYVVLSAFNRWLARPVRLPVPVVVVGNITVGGAGKTPVTLWLAQQLKRLGWRPGIVSRGYGRTTDDVREVTSLAAPDEVGDEPVLLARRAAVPVYVGQRRAEAGLKLLAAHPEVNVILCDDGLQHYRLARDVELAVFDARGAGNGWRLPLGPLREPLSRLATVNAIIGPKLKKFRASSSVPLYALELCPGRFYRLGNPAQTASASELAGRPKRYAVAGIGHPQRFFQTLEDLGLGCETRSFPDHHRYCPEDLAFAADGIVLMTEKDAVKCQSLNIGEAWVLPVEAELPSALVDLIVEKIRGRPLA